jgi:hypothetical protein
MKVTAKVIQGLLITICNYDKLQDSNTYEGDSEGDNEGDGECGTIPTQSPECVNNEEYFEKYTRRLYNYL